MVGFHGAREFLQASAMSSTNSLEHGGNRLS